ncbi:hypothetical protein OPV22_016999 [Ensete ventricosum]|uniref:Uncharacterized protein n=1 Tax=Ensete ventricosum TaxID=4639 RepID=A0AAV8R149_ENSVE|nr:hypothetical protein OPV22_016999 [Ensete ventricosum]
MMNSSSRLGTPHVGYELNVHVAGCSADVSVADDVKHMTAVAAASVPVSSILQSLDVREDESPSPPVHAAMTYTSPPNLISSALRRLSPLERGGGKEDFRHGVSFSGAFHRINNPPHTKAGAPRCTWRDQRGGSCDDLLSFSCATVRKEPKLICRPHRSYSLSIIGLRKSSSLHYLFWKIPTRTHHIAIEPFQKSIEEFGFSHQKLVLAVRRSKSERKRRKDYSKASQDLAIDSGVKVVPFGCFDLES